MQPNTHLNKGDCDKNPASDFYRRYRVIVGSLGYLVTRTLPDLAWAYSEFSKYVQFSGKNYMLAAEHVLSYLSDTWTIRYSRNSHENPNVLWGWVDADSAGILTPADHTRDMFSWWMVVPSLGRVSAKTTCHFPLSSSRLNLSQLAKQAKKRSTYVKRWLNFDFPKLKPLFSTKTTLLVLL